MQNTPTTAAILTILTITITTLPQNASATPQAFTYTGAQQTYTKPTGYNAVRFWIWGGGGAGGHNSYNGGTCCSKRGGGGGYISGVITGFQTTSTADIKLEVGGGGAPGLTAASRAWPDGGVVVQGTYANWGYGGDGGASSRIYDAVANDPENPYAVAGGGGGGGSFRVNDNGNTNKGGGGCLQYTIGKSDELIDGHGTNGGKGGEEATRYGAPGNPAKSTSHMAGAGGGGYRGGEGGDLGSNNWAGGGGGRSYYNTQYVILEDDDCGDRAANPGGHELTVYPGAGVGSGGTSSYSATVSSQAGPGGDGYIILEAIVYCPTGLTYNPTQQRCECTAGNYVNGTTCTPCTTCDAASWASSECDGYNNAQCNTCDTCDQVGEYKTTDCTATTNAECAACVTGSSFCPGMCTQRYKTLIQNIYNTKHPPHCKNSPKTHPCPHPQKPQYYYPY